MTPFRPRLLVHAALLMALIGHGLAWSDWSSTKLLVGHFHFVCLALLAYLTLWSSSSWARLAGASVLGFLAMFPPLILLFFAYGGIPFGAPVPDRIPIHGSMVFSLVALLAAVSLQLLDVRERASLRPASVRRKVLLTAVALFLLCLIGGIRLGLESAERRNLGAGQMRERDRVLAEVADGSLGPEAATGRLLSSHKPSKAVLAHVQRLLDELPEEITSHVANPSDLSSDQLETVIHAVEGSWPGCPQSVIEPAIRNCHGLENPLYRQLRPLLSCALDQISRQCGEPLNR